MNIIFQINGGIGKCVIATAVTEVIKKNHPDCNLIVVSGYPDVFMNNPFVDRSFAFGEHKYFYSDYVDGKDFKVFAHDPYLDTEHLKQEEHVIETWCKLFGLKYEGEKPKVYLTEREFQFYSKKYTTDKPIMVIQTNGGVEQNLKYSWARDIPHQIAQQVVDRFKFAYTIFHIRREDQPVLTDTVTITDSFRAIATVIAMSSRRLFMDSFAQHTATALGLNSTVLWVANSPVVFGYENNDNIIHNPFTKKPELKNSYLNKFNILGEPLEFPFFSEKEIFNVEDIIKSLSEEK
jgi:hypothetical protein